MNVVPQIGDFMEFLVVCFILSIIFGISSGLSKTSLFNKSSRITSNNSTNDNYYILFLDYNNK